RATTRLLEMMQVPDGKILQAIAAQVPNMLWPRLSAGLRDAEGWMGDPELDRKSGRAAITLDEVAALAGVSAATVSRALNRPGLVKPLVRQRIELAAAQLGYVPN